MMVPRTIVHFLRGDLEEPLKVPIKMDASDRNASVTSAHVRTQLAYKNRWKTLLHNPKILIIAFFAS
jgi:hypothetical protein